MLGEVAVRGKGQEASGSFPGSAWEHTDQRLCLDELDMLWKQGFRGVSSQAEPGTESTEPRSGDST